MLEIERKFAPTPTSIDLLTRNAGRPKFTKLESLGITTFEDVYYDQDDVLNFKDIYVRRRSYLDASGPATTHWEAKVKVGGNFTNSAFREVTGIEAVSEIVQHHHPVRRSSSDNMGILDTLDVWARFVTKRRQWRVNEHFLIVLDEADFGHLVGEVEVATEQTCDASEQDAVLGLDKQIEDFMLHHEWAFPPGKVQGKLTAYFEQLEKARP